MTEKDKEINELRRQNAELMKSLNIVLDTVRRLASVVSDGTGTMLDIVQSITEDAEKQDATVYRR